VGFHSSDISIAGEFIDTVQIGGCYGLEVLEWEAKMGSNCSMSIKFPFGVINMSQIWIEINAPNAMNYSP
jgi:hypothetical protein